MLSPPFLVTAKGEVVISVKADETYIHLCIRDNGNGIPKELQANVFKFGISSKSNKLHKMHGVGLFHCQLITEAHNGKLELGK